MSSKPTRVVAGIVLIVAALATEGETIVPSVARTAGRNNAFFQTDLRLLNGSPSDSATAVLVFHPSSGGPPVTSAEIAIGPRRQAGFNNVVESLFGFSTDETGLVRALVPDFVTVSSRTYNVNDPCTGGTLGSWIPGLPTDAALTSGLLPQAAGSASGASGYRTNLILANPSTTDSVSVTVRVRLGDGTSLGDASATIAPSGSLLRDAFAWVGATAVTTDDAFIEFVADRPLLALSSVVDNRTNDAAVFVAVAATPPAADTLVRVGDVATFTGAYGVSGRATVTSPNTIRLTGFNAGGTAPGIDLRVGLSSTPRNSFPVVRVIGRQSFSAATLDLTLPQGIDLAAFDTFTVWCYEFNVLIAEGRFSRP